MQKGCEYIREDRPLLHVGAGLAEYLAQGYERVRVTGKKGTIILFDSKIIHRANSAKNCAWPRRFGQPRWASMASAFRKGWSKGYA